MAIKILTEEQTIDKIKEGYSVSRLGDGEFIRIILENRGISRLQSFDPIMRKKLINIINNPVKKLMIGIPPRNCKRGWIKIFHKKFFKFISGREIEKNIFASAFFSRPSVVINKSTDTYFKKIMSIWNNRKIVLINFNNDLINHHLFKKCKIDFIEIPRNDCFKVYSEVFDKCKKFYNRKRIFLLSAGPMATCMTYDLTCDGEQAIDIGQIALEYSLFKKEKNIIKWTSQNQYKNKFKTKSGNM